MMGRKKDAAAIKAGIRKIWGEFMLALLAGIKLFGETT